ncbi:MAG: hypothetical protein GX135_01385 [Candidatus Cloacimonetes bacterium]|nr:hypothetical protein [Candidatus Cloacimonadota bacterium]
MKKSIVGRYHLFWAVLMGLILLQSAVLFAITLRGREFDSLVNDLQTALILSVLVIFIYSVVIYNIVPLMLKKNLRRTEKLISEITHGNYDVDLDAEIKELGSDREIIGLLEGLKQMLRSIHGFDQAKENKIYEHDQRIKQLINLLPQGVIIALNNGDISYCNDTLRRRYPSLVECLNIRDLRLKDEFDQRVFSKLMESLNHGDNLYDQRIPSSDYHKLTILNGAIVRNAAGDSIGGVYTLSFSEHAKQD